ncbi:MAG TPA: Tat pathway signal sequence domain protein, partial [Candidatus Synoicihabitans sp.]|nr:Tat pathway signal sequence domain protein [Candidatus Synoicihabitans sp.]
MTDRITRRRFIAASALASTALGNSAVGNSALAAGAAGVTAGREIKKQTAGTWCHWLDGRAPAVATGTTWGMPWARGKHRANTRFALRDGQGRMLPLQSWPIAYWPDGSLKWTAHAIAAGMQLDSDLLEVVPGRSSPKPATVLSAKQNDAFIEVDTGVIVCRVPRSGNTAIESIQRGGQPALQAGRLILLRQDATADDVEAQACEAALKIETFTGEVEQAELEHSGPL